MILEMLNSILWPALFLPLFVWTSLRLFFVFLCRPTRDKTGARAIEKNASGGEEKQGLRPFQAASTALAATVGVGNIVGTSQAIAMGGPGAVFWMWLAGIFGISVKMAEIRFGLWKSRGTAGYVSAALGKAPALIYSFAAFLSVILVSDMAQMNATVSACAGLFDHKSREISLLLGAGFTALLAACLFRGTGSVGKACSFLVPIMVLVYAAASGAVLLRSPERIAPSLVRILRGAFRPAAAIGGASGYGIKSAMLWGLRRGALSNEAGLGTAGNVHSLVKTERPEKHALWAIAEILVDTFLLCTLSALTILCGGWESADGMTTGPELVGRVYAAVFGEKQASLLLAALLAVFGFSTTLGCYVNGLRCAERIGMEESPYRFLYLICAMLGTTLPLAGIWRMADGVNLVMAVPNLMALLVLAPRLRERKYLDDGCC